MEAKEVAIQLVRDLFEDHDDMAEEGDFERLLAKLDLSILEGWISVSGWKPETLEDSNGDLLALMPGEDWYKMCKNVSQEYVDNIVDALDKVWDDITNINISDYSSRKDD